MTAIRTQRFWVIGAALVWLGAAVLLWRTSVPDRRLPDVAAEDVFSAGYLQESGRYEDFLRANWALATVVHVVLLLLAVRFAPGARLRGIRGGVLLGTAILVAAWLARLPFVLAAHWWRRRHDVSEAGYGTILVDPWLERVGGLVVAAAAIALFMLLARRLGDRWWLVGGPAFAAVGSAFLLAQPLLLAPRLQPIDNPVVERDVQSLANELGVGEVEVEVRDASRRTKAINAEFYGLGPTRRIVLWDTALDKLTRNEIRVLAAHELGHVSASHLWKGVGWLFLFALPGAYVVARVTRRRGGLAEPAAVPLALLTLVLLELALLPVTNAITRRYEREADWIALRTTADPGASESLTVKLARAGLADPDPPAWARVVLETHPTPLERIALARSLRAEEPRAGS